MDKKYTIFYIDKLIRRNKFGCTCDPDKAVVLATAKVWNNVFR